MSNIKKPFQNLVSFLEANQNKKVSSILDAVIEMASSKGAGSSATTCYRNEAGEVQFIRCGYFQQWLPIAFVEFSKKEGTASGYAPMCKEGQSLWSKKQRDAKKAKEQVLEDVANGEVRPEDIPALLESIETARLQRDPNPFGSETVEEALEKDFEAIQAELEAAESVESVESEGEEPAEVEL